MAVSTGSLSIPKIEQPKWYGWWKAEWVWTRQRIISGAFRLMAFSAAIFQIVAFPNGPVPYNAFPDSFISGSKAYPPGFGYNAAELVGLVVAAGVYSLLKIVQPSRWQRVRAVSVLLLSLDIMAAVLMVHFSGGIHSPFILYTLVPVLSAALLKDYKVTIFVSVVTGGYVLAGNVFNPASNYSLTLQAVNDFLVYMIALGLVAALPYAINLHMGQKLQASGAATERRRISHELHDSVCQTLCGLRWQVERLAERLPVDGHLPDELKRMQELVKAAEQDARGLLEVVRTLDNSDKFLSNIRRQLEQLRHYAGINYRLECEDTEIKLPASIERELSMLCIEVLANVKKHAGARNVLFSVKRSNGRVQVKITDDGRGFDVSNESGRQGHGLAIMRERAELIGGTLRVTSAIGKGTEIHVDLPEREKF
ncbi:MAG: sensor histidine kinase [Chloroflexi bacterium]|nr:sensor histidine kinase [Chloroflexota bacterium]